MFERMMGRKRQHLIGKTHMHVGRIALWGAAIVGLITVIREMPALIRYAKMETM